MSTSLLCGSWFHRQVVDSWRARYAVAFWTSSMTSGRIAPHVSASNKPPNILIAAGGVAQEFRRQRDRFNRLLQPDCYAVYSFEEKCVWDTWMDNTRLLVLTGAASCVQNGHQLQDYARNGGHLLAVATPIPEPVKALATPTESSAHWLSRFETATGGICVELRSDSDDALSSTLESMGFRCSRTRTEHRDRLTPAFLVSETPRPFYHPKLVWTDDPDHPVQAQTLPVLTNQSPVQFDPLSYFQNLKTDVIGRSLLYGRVMTSTHWLLEEGADSLPHGLAIVARIQTEARGRGGNVWMSPEGCAVFSLRLNVPIDSPIGRHLSFVQHLVALAVVLAIKDLPGCQDLAIGVKWPNDVYYLGQVKVGGVLATTTLVGRQIRLNLGCGVNLDNSKPTLSLNDVLEGSGRARITLETYLSSVFNQLEQLLEHVSRDRFDHVMDLYHRHWIHQDARVSVRDGERQLPARVLGVDAFGFLRVSLDGAGVRSVHPDGNSFDMLKGLIIPK